MSTSAINLRWNYTPGEIRQETEDIVARSRSLYDQIGSLKGDDLGYDNVIKALADGHASYFTKRNQLVVFMHVSSDKELRDASVAADKKLSELDVELSHREDVFRNLVAANKKFGNILKPEAKRFLERLIKLGQRDGLEHPKTVQEEIKTTEQKIRNLEIDFQKNLNEENSKFYFTTEELSGLPADLLSSLNKGEDGKLEVTLEYPHYFPCMMFVKNPLTRKRLESAFTSRCLHENTPILEELVALRHKKATLLGFPNHSAFVLDMRMAKNPENVSNFLKSLEEKLRSFRIKETNQLLQFKKEECADLRLEFDGAINAWDLRYYMARVEEKNYKVDQNKLKSYFPLDVVTKGLLRIYQDLLDLKFELIENAQTWHDDVTLYSATDSTTGKLMGFFYLDLFPREGKHGHACCMPLQPGCAIAGADRRVPVVVMLTNFTKPAQGRPSLLLHEEVETYFHEFGHAMHNICSQAEFALFSGTKVERDFVEAPSQMLENWVWTKPSLMFMSGHHQDHTPIPEDSLKSLILSRNANVGLMNCRQILLATYDQAIHTDPKVNIKELFCKLSEDLLGVKCSPGTFMPASFWHLGGGYDAQYYGYLWSEVFSADMFHTKFSADVLSKKAGSEYRKCILTPGGSIDAVDMLNNFLGREPSQEPFLKVKGLVV